MKDTVLQIILFKRFSVYIWQYILPLKVYPKQHTRTSDPYLEHFGKGCIWQQSNSKTLIPKSLMFKVKFTQIMLK